MQMTVPRQESGLSLQALRLGHPGLRILPARHRSCTIVFVSVLPFSVVHVPPSLGRKTQEKEKGKKTKEREQEQDKDKDKRLLQAHNKSDRISQVPLPITSDLGRQILLNPFEILRKELGDTPVAENH